MAWKDYSGGPWFAWPALVQRELRPYVRRPVMFWSRSALAGCMLIGWWSCLSITMVVTGGAPDARMAMNWLSQALFFIVVVVGVYETAGCLSYEIREGTLRLLVLTDLRPAGLMLGKLLGRLVPALYTVLAVLPTFALPLVLGGVGWRDVGAVWTVLLVALVWAQALGLLVSAYSRRDGRAYVVAFLLSVLLGGGPVVLDYFLNRSPTAIGHAVFSVASPLTAMLDLSKNLPFVPSRPVFWRSVLWTLASATCFWLIAAARIRSIWTGERSRVRSRGKPNVMSRRSRRRAEPRDAALYLSRIAGGPMLKLRVMGVLVILLSGGLGRIWLANPSSNWLSLWPLGLAMLLAYAYTAYYAQLSWRSLVDNRILALLLTTPFNERTLLRAHTLLFLRIVPAMLVGCVILALGPLMWRLYLHNYELAWLQATCLLAVVVGLPTSLAAVFWCAMWLGIRGRRPWLAPLLTLGMVILAPLALMVPLVFFVLRLLPFGWQDTSVWWFLVPWVIKDGLFLSWASGQVLCNLRTAVTEQI